MAGERNPAFRALVSSELMAAMEISIEQQRLLRAGDVQASLELSSEAGWNQTPEDWKMLIEIAPHGCFALEMDGRVVSTTTLMCYQRRLAWVGMVLTKMEYRGRGFARRLLVAALDHAESLGIETMKLDATDQGRPLYERLGFKAEQPIERWVRQGSGQAFTARQQPSLSKRLLEFDAGVFGADRSTALAELERRGPVYVDSDAFLLARPGRITAYLGPCVASDPVAARNLMEQAIIDSPAVSWSWDLLPANRHAVTLASELGFTRQRSLTRMARGKTLRARDDQTYAIAGFELG